jgi:hypothetical protein
MSSNDVATNQNTGSDQKSDTNKQDQAGSGTDDPKHINGKNVVGKTQVVFLFFLCFIILRAFINEIQNAPACEIKSLYRLFCFFFSNQSDWYSQMVQR